MSRAALLLLLGLLAAARAASVCEPPLRASDPGPVCNGHCCSATSEVTLRTTVRRDLETLLRHQTVSLHSLLSTTAATFQNHVIELARQSETKTHHLFSQVYQRMSQVSKEPISALYFDIRSYINNTGTESKPDLDIAVSVKEFFTNLFPLVYHHAVNLQHADFSEDYKLCLKRKIDDIQPFGDIPRLVSTSIFRSSEATRVMLQALALGSEVLNATDLLVETSSDHQSSCHNALLKMMYCPKCQGLSSQTKPCSGYCLNVLRGCLSQHISEMDTPWNGYLEAVEKLMIEVKTIDTTLNIDSAIKDLETRISEAIMYAMENGPSLEKKVKWSCGNTRLSESPDNLKAGADDKSGTGRNRAKRPPPSATTTSFTPSDIEMLHFLASVSKLKYYFSNMADMLCRDETFAVQTAGKDCWNGEKIGEYTKDVLFNGNFQKYNPEVQISTDSNTTPNNRIVTLSERLRSMRQLIMSHVTVMSSENHMFNDEADIAEVEGSGSGKYEHWSDDDDENNWAENGSGSGHSGIDENIDTVQVVSGSNEANRGKTQGTAVGGVDALQRISLCSVLISIVVSSVLRPFCARNFDILL